MRVTNLILSRVPLSFPQLGLRYLTRLPFPLLLEAPVTFPAHGAQHQGLFPFLFCCCKELGLNSPGQYWKGECYLFLYCVYFVLVYWFPWFPESLNTWAPVTSILSLILRVWVFFWGSFFLKAWSLEICRFYFHKNWLFCIKYVLKIAAFPGLCVLHLTYELAVFCFTFAHNIGTI